MDHRTLSFIWTVLDLLLIVKCNRGALLASPTRPPRPTLAEQVSDSLLAEFGRCRAALWASFVERINLCEQVEEALELLPTPGRHVYMFGSSSTYLFDPATSDVDVCLLPAPLPTSPTWPHPLSKASQIGLLEELHTAMKPAFPEVRLLSALRMTPRSFPSPLRPLCRCGSKRSPRFLSSVTTAPPCRWTCVRTGRDSRRVSSYVPTCAPALLSSSSYAFSSGGRVALGWYPTKAP